MSAAAEQVPALAPGEIAMCEFCVSRFSLPDKKIARTIPRDTGIECCACDRPIATMVFGGRPAATTGA